MPSEAARGNRFPPSVVADAHPDLVNLPRASHPPVVGSDEAVDPDRRRVTAISHCLDERVLCGVGDDLADGVDQIVRFVRRPPQLGQPLVNPLPSQ